MPESEGTAQSFLESLAQNETLSEKRNVSGVWKVLIVDDDREVHDVTNLVLRNFSFEDKGLVILSARSAKEAEVIMGEEEDIALILLDVVMESDSAGLDFARYVRDTLKNKRVRIILRTGHAGQAPEDEVIVRYDINDYKEKTELTSRKLKTAVIAALRAYRDISTIDAHRKGLQMIIDSLSGLFKLQSLKKLASGVLTQLSALLDIGPESLCVRSGMTVSRDDSNGLHVVAASGEYERYVNGEGVLPPEICDDLSMVFSGKQTVKRGDSLITYTRSKHGSENAIFLSCRRELNEWELRLVDIFSMNASIAFDNNYLRDELEATQKEIIMTLGEVAEKRSHETGSHVKRVAEYSVFLGRHYGLAEEDLALLGFAAPTHDIGKIGIPDSVLNKPGKLTDGEMAVMQTHAELGCAMLSKSSRPILRASALIAKTHHEYWDGTGYPHGLCGFAIPPFGRIVALADVFDALAHDRIYKKAWPMSDIVDLVKRQRGIQFEPKLVDIFLANLPELAEIKSRFPD